MQIAQVAGEMSLAEADIMRRSSAKFSGQRDLDRLRDKFRAGPGMMGLTTETARRDLDDGGEIRRVRFLQSACGDVRGHFVPHGVFEDASSGGVSGGDVQRGGGFLSRVGVCGRGEALGDRGTAAFGESFAMEYTAEAKDAAEGDRQECLSHFACGWKARAARRVDAGEGFARGDDYGDCAGAGRRRGVSVAGGFFAARAGGEG